MNIDLTSLCFNSNLSTGGGTPSWGTALGQSSPEYKFSYPGAEEILVAMNYCYVPLSDLVSCKLGKGGHEYHAITSQSVESKYEIVMAAIFKKCFVCVNEEKIAVSKPFALLVTKENENTHKGRKSLKYSDSIIVGDVKNKDFYDAVGEILGGRQSCWFAYAINVENQDELVLSIVKVSDSMTVYNSSEERKNKWLELIPASSNYLLEDESNKKNDWTQIIYYGVPGCGKSHQVKEDLKAKGIPQNRTKRVVFHPDYCNADFVGQIMPETKNGGGIRYNFKAGPFAKILRVAYENPNFEYALIIEEINRGNAAAIFGDIFQLLDRKTRQEQTENLNGNTYGIGWSDYCVNNDYINAYFRGAYDGEIVDGPLPEKKLGNTTFNDNVDIRLPPNLSIYATMNTSDQNVFTLDNAFQRRWKMKQISNTLNCSDPKEAAQYNLTIGNSNVKWGKFREEINNKIVDPDYTSNFSSLEDKRLGGWFVVPEKEGDTFISKEYFADKVIKFLWDDAFKFNRAIFGDYEKKSLELVIEVFVGDVGFGVFEENFRKCLNVAESSADQQSDGQS